MKREKRYKLRYETERDGFRCVEYVTLCSYYRLDMEDVYKIAGALLDRKGVPYTGLKCFYEEWVYVIDGRELQQPPKKRGRKKKDAETGSGNV